MPSTRNKSAAPFVPVERELPVLAEAVQRCEGCDLYRNATQAVFGELDTGKPARRPRADIMMVGEQPGDQEDKMGRPFVGPAGRLLDQCLEQAEIDRDHVYVTNAVKHFKWEPRGKIRLHKKPSIAEVSACKPWLAAEIETVHPRLIVCLGATAAQSLLGSSFRIMRDHGVLQHPVNLPPVLATLHPSAVLRAQTDEDRASQMKLLIDDLRAAAKIVRGATAAA